MIYIVATFRYTNYMMYFECNKFSLFVILTT